MMFFDQDAYYDGDPGDDPFDWTDEYEFVDTFLDDDWADDEWD